jgi:hypothetical protein
MYVSPRDGWEARAAARRRHQAEHRAMKAACDAEWIEHLHVDQDEHRAEVVQLNQKLRHEIGRAQKAARRRRRAPRPHRDEHRSVARRARRRGAGRPGRRTSCCRSGSSEPDDAPAARRRSEEGGER